MQIPEDKTEAGSDYQSRFFVIEELIRHGFVCSVRGSNETKEAYMGQNDDASDDETSNETENDFLGNLFWENKVPWDPKPSPEDMKDGFYEDVDSDDPEWWEADDIGD